jgi:hypothetical protein
VAFNTSQPLAISESNISAASAWVSSVMSKQNVVQMVFHSSGLLSRRLALRLASDYACINLQNKKGNLT